MVVVVVVVVVMMIGGVRSSESAADGTRGTGGSEDEGHAPRERREKEVTSA